MTGNAGVRSVLLSARHSVLYLFWAAFYLWLVLVAQPCLFIFVRGMDWCRVRWPWAGTREYVNDALTRFMKNFFPAKAEYFFSRIAFGPYVGSDRERPRDVPKRLPLHSVSLSGCAWQTPYHIGVCKVLKEEGLVDENTKWLGSSCGALIATAAALGIDLDGQLRGCASIGSRSAAKHACGPFGLMSHYIGPQVARSIPADAHKLASGRLFLSVTVSPYQSQLYGNKYVSQFRSCRHLYDMLMSSSYIPFYNEIPVRPGRGEFYWDGGFSDNQPVLCDDDGVVLTTTVSPSSRMADISPAWQRTCNMDHLCPGRTVEDALVIHDRGVADAKLYAKKVKAENAVAIKAH